MDITKNWKAIRNHFNKSFKSNLHVSIASVNSNNLPTVTPVGTLFLNGDQTGFYFEKYISKLPENGKSNSNICVLAVNSTKWFWIKSLYKLKFNNYPALKLYGKLGTKREASEIEINEIEREYGKSEIKLLNEKQISIEFPVDKYPEKIKSFNLDKV